MWKLPEYSPAGKTLLDLAYSQTYLVSTRVLFKTVGVLPKWTAYKKNK